MQEKEKRDVNKMAQNTIDQPNMLQGDSYSKILTDPAADKSIITYPSSKIYQPSFLDSLNYLAAKQLKLAIEKKLSKDSNKQYDNASLARASEDITSTVPSENYIPTSINGMFPSSKSVDEVRLMERPPRDSTQDAKIPKVNFITGY